MAREYRKGIYTLTEISAEAIKKYPGRWVSSESAYASVKNISRQLGIGDINGKKKYKQIAAVDVVRIFELLEKTNRGKKKAPGQADLFSLLPEPVTPASDNDNFSYKPSDKFARRPVPAQIIQADETANAAPETLAELYQTADELARAFCNFAQALKSYTKGA